MPSPSLLWLIFVILSNSRPASSLSVYSVLPHQGSAIPDEIKCYSLPYGGIGFASHLITYYTIIALSSGRSPFTWKKNKCWKFDLILGTIGLVCTTSIAILTIVRCRQRWEFVLLGIWKMTLSLTLGFISVHAAIAVRSTEEGKGRARMTQQDVLWWLVFYVPGLVVGLTGLGSLARNSWAEWRRRKLPVIVTGIFIGAVVVLGILAFMMWLWLRRRNTMVPTLDGGGERGFHSAYSLRDERWYSSDEMMPVELPVKDQRIRLSATSRLDQHNDDDERFESRVQENQDGFKIDMKSRGTQEAFVEPARPVPKRALLSRPISVISRAIGGLFDSVAVQLVGIMTLAMIAMWLMFVGILAALYSDWAIAFLAGNMGGVPTSDNAILYWTYFFAKRISLFSF